MGVKGMNVGFRVILIVSLVLCIGLVSVADVEKIAASIGTVDIVIDADNTTAGIQDEITVEYGSQFTVVVQVQPQGGQEVKTVDAYVDFDTSYLSVDNASYAASQNIVAHPNTLFGNPAYRNMDNDNGYADYSDGTAFMGTNPTTEFPMFYIVFNATNTTPISGTEVTFHTAIARKTDAFVGDNATVITGNLTGITVHVANPVVAETSISETLDQATGKIVVANVNIDRIKDPTDNSTANITGGIGSYSAIVSSAPGSGIEVLGVNGVSPFEDLTFDNVTGIFSVDNVTSPIQADNTTVAEMVLRLSGNATTPYDLTVAFQAIGAAGDPELNVPEEHDNTLTFQRGDANGDGKISMTDAMFAAQVYVKVKPMDEIHALNAASVNYDGADGDKVSMTDAMFIAQCYVKVRDADFELK
ncbi:dockerin type I repeat-containing protein [Chloroflexota bacterium]